MRIAPLNSSHAAKAARLLFDTFREPYPHAWPTLSAARAEVSEALESGRIAFGAFRGELVGWIGAIPQYEAAGRATGWELHPLAVQPDRQRTGVGRALLAALEDELASRDAVVVYLGTDDENGVTVAAQADGANAMGRVIDAMNDPTTDVGVDHPYIFYRRNGYRVCGIVPHANGPGRPDIMMHKLLTGRS